MSALSPQQVDAIVRANADALGLPIAADHRPGVNAFFALAAGMAERVLAEPLTHEDESGSVFRPVPPRGPVA
ncbi:DUF4089 domain-containing protein [uncultured Piscinibacter sp.]|uniref:DUF4089 domain-containing protein n=1 Tax=uncultured Piscinibacter sp. TaxID=1131835 RepID=UPI00260D9CC4|nr:DUF4089 domain-containing protein [uncultured Piscinibacter sp.]